MKKEEERSCENCGERMNKGAGGYFCPNCQQREDGGGKVVTPGIGQDASW